MALGGSAEGCHQEKLGNTIQNAGYRDWLLKVAQGRPARGPRVIWTALADPAKSVARTPRLVGRAPSSAACRPFGSLNLGRGTRAVSNAAAIAAGGPAHRVSPMWASMDPMRVPTGMPRNAACS